MCGRFTIAVDMDELLTFFMAEKPDGYEHTKRYNVAPMQRVPVVVSDGERNQIVPMRWGLVPFWAKDDKIGSKMINARSETIAEKPAFRSLVTRKRCIIGVDGFYEWKQEGDRKQPFRIVMKNRSIFSFAGLYDTWDKPDGGQLTAFTIITTAPNELMAPIHDRMPVVLKREDEALWLDPSNQDKQQLLDLLVPYDADQMRAYPVSSAVGSVKNTSAELIQEVEIT